MASKTWFPLGRCALACSVAWMLLVVCFCHWGSTCHNTDSAFHKKNSALLTSFRMGNFQTLGFAEFLAGSEIVGMSAVN